MAESRYLIFKAGVLVNAPVGEVIRGPFFGTKHCLKYMLLAWSPLGHQTKYRANFAADLEMRTDDFGPQDRGAYLVWVDGLREAIAFFHDKALGLAKYMSERFMVNGRRVCLLAFLVY